MKPIVICSQYIINYLFTEHFPCTGFLVKIKTGAVIQVIPPIVTTCFGTNPKHLSHCGKKIKHFG